jgi:hypothetical protein
VFSPPPSTRAKRTPLDESLATLAVVAPSAAMYTESAAYFAHWATNPSASPSLSLPAW